MIRSKVFTLGVLCASLATVPSTALAQLQPSPPQPNAPARRQITLQEVVTIARADPPAILLAIARQRANEAQIGLARSAYYPTLAGSASATLTAQNGNQLITTGAGTMAFPVGSSTVSEDMTAQFRWTIWDFGRTRNNVRAAELGALASTADLRNAERLAVTQAAAAFYLVLADNELVASDRATLEQREHELQISAGLVQAGARPPIEQTRAQVARDSAALDLTNAQTATLNDTVVLATALAFDPAQPVDVIATPELPIDDDVGRAAATALATRPEVVSARLAVEQANANLAATRASYYPILSGTGTASLRHSDRVDVGGTSTTEVGSVGVAITVPIFDVSIPASVRLAEASVNTARALLAQEELSVRAEAVQAAIAVRSARQSVDQSEQLARGAAANLAQAQGRYAAGAASLLELVDAQAEDTTARVAVVRARLQLELAKVRLLGALGRLDDLGRGP